MVAGSSGCSSNRGLQQRQPGCGVARLAPKGDSRWWQEGLQLTQDQAQARCSAAPTGGWPGILLT